MLGWEFPPFISGGLGTACYGLTRALDALGHEITFVLPRAVDQTQSSHVRLLSPETSQNRSPVEILQAVRKVQAQRGWSSTGRVAEEATAAEVPWIETIEFTRADFPNTRFRALPSEVVSPYGSSPTVEEALLAQEAAQQIKRAAPGNSPSDNSIDPDHPSSHTSQTPSIASQAVRGFFAAPQTAAGADYAGDVIEQSRRYAQMCLAMTAGENYDVIHAHDWMTFPAGMTLARITGIPLVVHVHSTEYDRSGESVNQEIFNIERRGMHAAIRVITVSHWTRSIVQYRYRVDGEKVRVVWNGIESPRLAKNAMGIKATDKIVLFLGRITMQKGPEYFIAAAKRVLEKMRNVKFIVAGSGDMALHMIELAAEMGIGHKVLFTGFLRGGDVEQAYKMADCYVMPSVSEPFGIAPLEAISHNVPVIISKQSGVSEALTHALKVDFWDVDEMANKIIAVLRHPPLGQTLRHHGAMELRSLSWEGAAAKCVEVYDEAIESIDRLTSAI